MVWMPFVDSADIVLITHEHGDHNQLYRVKQKVTCQVIRSSDGIQSGIYQTFTIDNVTVQAVAAYNQNHNKNTCVGYVIEFDGIKLYHAGDTGKIPEMDSLASQNLDYALLPMEGIYTITPEVASEAAAVIMAKHDIPIHTMTTPDTYSDEFVARFTSPNKLVVHPGEVIDLVSVSALKEESNAIAYGFILNQNYPNPFNPSTVISYRLAVNSKVSLKIYDVTGREIITLVNEEQTAGQHSVVFDGSNFASGIYFYKLVSSSGLVQIRKMILLN